MALSVAANVRTAVKSGHKVGKTYLVASIALWWVMTRPRGRVVITASNSAQVRTVVWPILRKLYAEAGGDTRFRPDAEHGIPVSPDAGLRFTDIRAVYGLTTDQPERMQGHSGDQLLFLVDEASGFPDTIYEAVQGNMAGGGRILATGNPNKTSGWFFDAFTTKRDLWSTFSIDSRSTPNCTGDGEPIAGLASPPWVEDMILEYGGGDMDRAEENPNFAIRVAGQFPEQATNSVIGLGAIELAKSRWTPEQGKGRLQVGVDPALYGDDDTSITPSRGEWMGPTEDHHGLDGAEKAEAVIQLVRRYRMPSDGRVKPLVVVDDTGGYGDGVISWLRRQHSDEVEVIGVSSSASCGETDSDGHELYANTRAHLWFNLKDWLETGAIPPDPKAETEMLAPTYDFDAKGRRRVEKKDHMKARLGRSPDRADSRALAVYRARPALYVGKRRHRDDYGSISDSVGGRRDLSGRPPHLSPNSPHARQRPRNSMGVGRGGRLGDW